MPSPFPGMNPYFEQAAHWQDFHTEFLTVLRRRLAPRVAPGYIVQLEEHVFIHDLPPEPRRPVGRADLAVARVERLPFLEVRNRRGRELITVIELLSPSNKRPGNDREHYLAKRRELLRGPAHLVEIDLLRGWPPMPAEGRPPGDYSVLVSRADRRPAAAFWPIPLRDRLPEIPIPLKAPDEEVTINLQDVLHETYDGPGYELFIYTGSPEPPLSPTDAEWAGSLVPRVEEAGG